MSADLFVYLDVVQFSKNGIQNRNQIKTQEGAAWLTLPVKHHLGQTLSEVQLADSNCGVKHWRTLQANYARTPGFKKWKDELEELLTQPYPFLLDFAIASVEWMVDKLEIETRIVKASALEGIHGQASKLVASICKTLDATCYLTGTGAFSYLDINDFEEIKCDLLVQKWKSPTYEQAYPEMGFIPDLSTIDVLLNCPDTAREMIRSSGGWEAHPLNQ
jgi:hypothetical protein